MSGPIERTVTAEDLIDFADQTNRRDLAVEIWALTRAYYRAVPAALPPAPGVNALDTPEAREAVAEIIGGGAVWDECREIAGHVLAALAPHVAAAQRATAAQVGRELGAFWEQVMREQCAAAFRAGVEAAAGVCRYVAEVNARYAVGEDGKPRVQFEAAAEAAGDCVEGINALPVPVGFAEPEPSTQTRHAEFWRGRTRGREDAAEACQRYAALLREEAAECHEGCDGAGEADAMTRASAADGCAAFIEQLGPVEEADEPGEVPCG